MFSKIVAIEPVSLIPSAEEALHTFANEVVMYPDIPADDEEIVRRIGDADAVLLSYTSSIRREVMERCPNIKYIGMCCSLYSPESANVDIIYANEHGIKVTGIRDYGDEGVVEYVISELVRSFHGFGQPAWEGEVREITGLKAGIIGLGKSGGMIADALRFFGAENLRLQSRFPLQQLRSGKEHIATTELFHRIATVTIPVATAVRDGISLEQDHTILFQINLRSMYGCIFFNSGFCDLRDHQGTEPCQRSLFKEVSSGILHG